jgi:peptide deformylase
VTVAQLPIVNYGDPVLRARGEPVRAFDGALAQLAGDMLETMRAAQGIGLAAPQVGRSLQFFVLDTRHDPEPLELDGRPVTDPSEVMPMAFANAEVTVLPGEEEAMDEGCLSFPGVRGEVRRVERVTVDFRDLTGAPRRLVATGLLARCILHEHDHCQGVLFIDRMSPGHRLRAEPKLRRLLRETQAGRREA